MAEFEMSDLGSDFSDHLSFIDLDGNWDGKFSQHYVITNFCSKFYLFIMLLFAS